MPKLALDRLAQVKRSEHPGTVEIACGLGGIFIQHAAHGMFGGGGVLDPFLDFADDEAGLGAAAAAAPD